MAGAAMDRHEVDQFVVVTSRKASEIMAGMEDDEEALYSWMGVMSQLRPAEGDFVVDLHSSDASPLVGYGLLKPSADDCDRYVVPRTMAYADMARNVFKDELN